MDRREEAPGLAPLETAQIVADLLRVVDMLMPGVRYIAIQDYGVLNDAQVRAREWLRARGETRP